MEEDDWYDKCIHRREVKYKDRISRYICDANTHCMLTCKFTDMNFAKFVCKFYARESHRKSVAEMGGYMSTLLQHLDIPCDFIDKLETMSPDEMKRELIEIWDDKNDTTT